MEQSFGHLCLVKCIIKVKILFRRILPGLSKLTNGLVLPPAALSMFVSGSLCGMAHDVMVTNDIALQETPCIVCVETRATALQVFN